jgi:hypothetical protein
MKKPVKTGFFMTSNKINDLALISGKTLIFWGAFVPLKIGM